LMQNAFGALLSVTVAPLVLAPIAAEFGWRVAFFVAGIPGLILVLFVLRFVREPAAPPREPATARVFANPLQLLRVRNIALCGVIGACLVGWGLLIPPFLPLYLQQMRGMDPVASQQILGVLGFSTLIFGFLFPGLSDRVGRRPIMVAASLI